jgi:hypothetical protein
VKWQKLHLCEPEPTPEKFGVKLITMHPRKVLQHFEDLAEKLGIEIVDEKLGETEFPVKGGLCKVKGTFKIFLDRSESIEARIEILAKALSSFDLENVYLVPYIREVLERARRSS